MEKILLTPPNGWFIMVHRPASLRIYNFAGALMGRIEPTPTPTGSSVFIYGVEVKNGEVIRTFNHHSFHFLDDEANAAAFNDVQDRVKSLYDVETGKR